MSMHFTYHYHHLYNCPFLPNQVLSINHKIRLTAMYASLERYIPLFENYLKSDNPQTFLKDLNDATDRTILTILTDNSSDLIEIRKKMREVGIPSFLQEALTQFRYRQYLSKATKLDDNEISRQIRNKFSTNHFDYPKPSNVSDHGPSKKEDKTPSSLTLEQSYQKYLEQKLKAKTSSIRSMTDYAISKLPEATLLNLPQNQKTGLLERCCILYHFSPEFISKFLVRYEEETRRINKGYSLEKKLFSELTRDQINHLGKDKPDLFSNEDYVQLWFNLNYSEKINKFAVGTQYFTKQKHLQKRDTFLQIVKELEHHKHAIIKAYLRQLKAEILMLDIEVNNPELERLVEYLQSDCYNQNIRGIDSNFRNEVQSRRADLTASYKPRMRYALSVNEYGFENAVESYIEKLFKLNKDNKDNIKKLGAYFKESYLNKLNIDAMLSRGELPENIHDYYSTTELETIKNKKQIKLHSSNKRKYKASDAVELHTTLKNVKKIHIKIYELSLEKTSLLDENRYIDNEINLNFLKPSQEEVFEHKLVSPYAVEDVIIPINIPKKMGAFMVDLQGDTVTSRAVIRKGAILCLESFTEAGQTFNFYDENGRPLTKKQGLKVWISGRPVDLKDGNSFETDYRDQEQYVKIVASMGNYAESYQKKIQAEKYTFQVGYIYTPESFLVGKKAKILLHGRLKMNNNPMSLELLQDARATINVINNQDISTFYEFDIKKWFDSQDQVIEFPIQSYTQKININVTAKIMKLNKKETTVSSSKNIFINLGEDQQNFSDFYLEKDEKGHYSVNLKGMNGEPITNTQVLVSYVVRGVEQQQRITLKTDDKGSIHLGSLSIAKAVSVHCTSDRGRVDRTWNLNEGDTTYEYPKEFHVKMGQPFTLPISKSWTKSDITLLRTFDKYYADDYSATVEVKDGLLTLPAFTEEGYYIMKLLPIGKDIDIYTVKNIKWQGDTQHKQTVFDHEDGNIYTIANNPTRNLAVGEIKLFHEPQVNKVEINLANISEQELKNVRVHAFATNYISPDTHDIFTTANFNQQPVFNHQYAGLRNSSYYSNKQLSDEGAYVWNRQQRNETQVGNNLEKPGIFLKRTLVRQTNQEDEDLYDGDAYQDECALTRVDPNLKAAIKKKRQGDKDRGVSLDRGRMTLTSHNNFLVASGHLQTNLRGKSITIEVPLSYNQLELVVLTPTSAIKKSFSLKSSVRQFKDLSHVGIAETEEGKAWTMSRQVYSLKVGEERLVSRTSQWRTVGLKDIFEYANAKRMTLYEWHKHLLVWDNYDEAKKRQIYDKECCHELNTFIKFKDPQFFNSVVSKYIANKIVKNFVDYCLLEDIANVKEYTKLSKLNNLNYFEKALLVNTLVKSKTLEDEAKRIVQIMEMEQNSIKRNYQDFKHNFDTIINAKATEEEPQRRGGARTKQTARMSSAAPRSQAAMMRFADSRMEIEQEENECARMQIRDVSRRRERMEEKKPFVPVESTKQYTERTYYTVKNYKEEALQLVQPSPFWSSLARSFLEGNSTNFLSKDFMTIPHSIGFILAACFISSEGSANFQIQQVGQHYKLTAQAPLLLYVKEVKKQEYANKFGVQMNQRFLDPQNRYIYEDGIQVDREVEQFVVNKPYISQTVVTNTSGTPLELQILLDIPKGTIPLCSHEYTQIVNITLAAFTSQEFTRLFYCPSEGEFPIYPSNACRGSTIISRCAKRANIVVKKYLTTNKLESFNDILSSADNAKIIEYIQTKNIMDRNVFSPEAILWLLKDKSVYEKVLKCLKQRKYYNGSIWNFAFYHNDIETIRQIIQTDSNCCDILEPEVFEYFPYYSTRTHQFANETKSTIRNVQFKETYIRFLTASIVNNRCPSSFLVSFAYYLILQDRLKEAAGIIATIVEKYPNQHQIQVDYMRCFLDMSLNTHNFAQAREIILKYKDYPIESWRKLFDEVRRTLEVEDEEFLDLTDSKKPEEFHTQVVQEPELFKIIQPAETNIRVQIFEINMQTYFSEYPFTDNEGWYCFVQPSIGIDYAGNKETTEIIIKREDYPNVKDATVTITENKPGLPPKKVSTFTWNNPEVKVKTNEATGTIQVYVGKKKRPGAYVKIFSQRGNHINKFYRDGYTDMTGTFRYAMADLQQIKEFSILVVTDKGSLIVNAKPPSKLASY